MINFRYTAILIIFFSFFASLNAQYYINDIYINQKNVFDEETEDVFLSSTLNSLHFVTKQYIIEDEMLFKWDDSLDVFQVDETERNLRASGLFTKVNIIIDTVSDDRVDIKIYTQDRWSTYPNLLFGSGGGQEAYGAGIKEFNLFGTGSELFLDALYKSENDIEWEANTYVNFKRFLRSDVDLSGALVSNKYRTDQVIQFSKPFRSLSEDLTFGIQYTNTFGNDFLYFGNQDAIFSPVNEQRVKIWYGKDWIDNHSRFVTTLYGEWEKTDRGDPKYERAYDNSGKIFLNVMSYDQDYIKTNLLNEYKDEDLAVGGKGFVTMGKIFPTSNGGLSAYYLGAQIEKSELYNGSLYLSGTINGGASFHDMNIDRIYQSTEGLGFYTLSKKLLLAARIKQETVWRWDYIRQLVLDNDMGLRGYDANKLSGDNRIISNLELRFFPGWQFWIFKFSGVAFYDAGMIWNQSLKLHKAKVHNSVGLGLRIHDTRATGENSIYRIDFAFNLDENRLGAIVFTTDQLFRVFKEHVYELPKVYGTNFDF